MRQTTLRLGEPVGEKPVGKSRQWKCRRRRDAKRFFMAHAQQPEFNLYKRVGMPTERSFVSAKAIKNTRNKTETEKTENIKADKFPPLSSRISDLPNQIQSPAPAPARSPRHRERERRVFSLHKERCGAGLKLG